MEVKEKLIKQIDKRFSEWLDKNDNLLEIPIKESLGNAFFDAYEKGMNDLICKLADYLHVSLTFENPMDAVYKLLEKEE